MLALKYRLTFTLLALAVVSIFGVHQALAIEIIERFDVDIKINADASVDVEETIIYDFGADQRHGIFRTIPIKYKARGGNYSLRVSEISVTDEGGSAIPFATSTPGSHLEIKIGDADVFVTGTKTYLIRYKVGRAINYFDDHQELYWNATGNAWPVAINESWVRVQLPSNIDTGQIRRQCFAGITGSTDSCELNQQQGGIAVFSHTDLNSNEGLTIVVSLPPGTVIKPTLAQASLATARDNWVVAVPVLTLIVMFYLWWTRGRDPAGRGAIPAQYEPPKGLSPAQVGLLIDERADNVDISAEIVYLAVHGWLKINRLEDKKLFGKKIDYRFDRLRPNENPDSTFNQDLLAKLFDDKDQVKLSDLKNKFAADMTKLKQQLNKDAVAQGFFTQSPQTTRWIYFGVGLGVAVIGGFLGAISGPIAAASLVISSGIIIIIGWLMPIKTKQGVLVREHILGLKRYLSVAEKARLKFHNAPEKNPAHFDNLLPYAMVLGVETQWADQFKDIYKEEPNWYSGPVGAHFAVAALATDMGAFSSAASSTLTSTASSGGSGFSGGSGGGFGGGGGGSW